MLGTSIVCLLMGSVVGSGPRVVELPAGTLVGFKAAPGESSSRLFQHAREQDSPCADWAAIYVQLDIEQAVNYAPNQFDRGNPLMFRHAARQRACIRKPLVRARLRQAAPLLPQLMPAGFCDAAGESSVCIVALRVRAGQTLRVVICDDASMADVSLSSAAKAEVLRRQLFHAAEGPAFGAASDRPLLSALGHARLALCLLDSETFELAVPHELFREEILEADVVMDIQESRRMPCCIGAVTGYVLCVCVCVCVCVCM